MDAFNINRPLKAWDYELSDPSWRRWFDMVLGREASDDANPMTQALNQLRSTGRVHMNPSVQFQQGVGQPLMYGEGGDQFAIPGYSTREYTPVDAFDLNPALRGLKSAFRKSS